MIEVIIKTIFLVKLLRILSVFVFNMNFYFIYILKKKKKIEIIV